MRPLKLPLYTFLIVAVMLLLIFSMWTFGRTEFDTVEKSGGWVIHTLNMKTGLGEVQNLFYRLALTQQNSQPNAPFIIRTPGTQLEEEIRTRIGQLIVQTQDNHLQQQRLREISRYAEDFFRLVDSAPDVPPAALDPETPGERIRTLLYESLQEEDRLLAERQKTRSRRWIYARQAVTALAGFSCVLMLISLAAIFKYAVRNEEHKDLLRTDRQSANRANEAKSAFIANMSHEIRTPMTAILGYADLLLVRHSSPSERFELIQHIRRNGEHLLKLINDILDLSKIEAQKLVVEEHITELATLLEEVASVARQRVVEKNLSLDIRYATPLPVKIKTDSLRVKQILINLLGNAVKFTEKGGVTLMVEATEDKLSFHVSDTGIGIDADQVRTLFQPFNQGDVTTARRFGGTGLGLAISKKLATILQGTLNVQSQKNLGSTFSLTLPLNRIGTETFQDVLIKDIEEAELLSAFHSEAGTRGRILLVEDSVDNQNIIVYHLRRMGISVDVAENGRIGIERAMKALGTSIPYDLILMDMQLPEIDGYTAVSILREKQYHLPIIALTANVLDSDRKRAMAVGCNAFLGKPLQLKEFYSTVDSYIPQMVDTPPPPPPPASNTLHIHSTPDFKALREIFMNSLRARSEELRQAVNSGNTQNVERITHQLAGAAASYGFKTISRISIDIKNQLQSGEPLSRLIDNFKQLFEALEEAVTPDSSA